MSNIEKALQKGHSEPGPSHFTRYALLKERVLSHEYAMTMSGFPGGNDHGPEHIKRVLNNLGRLVGDRPLKVLSQYELFLAMASVLYHDIGILRGRKNHAATSAKLLSEEQSPHIFNDDDKIFLSSIVLSHSSNVDISKGPGDQHVRGYDVRPRLVAALVRLADELDEDIRRADPGLQAKLDLPAESQFYWRFSQRIRGIKIDRARSEILFNVAFHASDIGLMEDGVNGSFIELFLRKLFKINAERKYCNQYLADLAIKRVLVEFQPIRDSALSIGTHLVMDDQSNLEAIMSQVPAQLLDHGRRRTKGSRQVVAAPYMPRGESEEVHAVVNGYKLYFFRTNRQLSIQALSERSGVDAQLINNLEQVKVRSSAPKCFKTVARSLLSKIERALGCVGALEYGQSDDLLATYVMYYNVNYRPAKDPSSTAVIDFSPDTRAVVFDFGGTLTTTKSRYSTWERMWLSCDYTIEDAGQLLKQFRAKRITHQQWCDKTCSKLRAGGFTRNHMRRIIADISPVNGLKKTLRALHAQGTALYIVSGSIREIIASILGDEFALFSEVKANAVFYDDSGLINKITGHPFDFEGKAKFIKRVMEELRCTGLEVLFVGNSLNDTWASESGARTLCVNPANVDYTNTRVWNDYIQEMTSLEQILPLAQRREPMDQRPQGSKSNSKTTS